MSDITATKEGNSFVTRAGDVVVNESKFIDIDEACQRCRRWKNHYNFKSAEFCQGYQYGRGLLKDIISKGCGIICPRQDEDFLKKWEASQI